MYISPWTPLCTCICKQLDGSVILAIHASVKWRGKRVTQSAAHAFMGVVMKFAKNMSILTDKTID